MKRSNPSSRAWRQLLILACVAFLVGAQTAAAAKSHKSKSDNSNEEPVAQGNGQSGELPSSGGPPPDIQSEPTTTRDASSEEAPKRHRTRKTEETSNDLPAATDPVTTDPGGPAQDIQSAAPAAAASESQPAQDIQAQSSETQADVKSPKKKSKKSKPSDVLNDSGQPASQTEQSAQAVPAGGPAPDIQAQTPSSAPDQTTPAKKKSKKTKPSDVLNDNGQPVNQAGTTPTEGAAPDISSKPSKKAAAKESNQVLNDNGQPVKQAGTTPAEGAPKDIASGKSAPSTGGAPKDISKSAPARTKQYNHPSRPANISKPTGSSQQAKGPGDSETTSLNQKNTTVKTNRIVNNVTINKKVYVNTTETVIVNKQVNVHYHDHDWAVPSYYFWNYDYPYFFDANWSPYWGSGHAIWYFDRDPRYDGDWYYAYPYRYPYGCDGAYQRAVQINYPRWGDYLCVDVPTEPAIWIPNPNDDPYMRYVAITECPDGFVPQFATYNNDDPLFPGLMGDFMCATVDVPVNRGDSSSGVIVIAPAVEAPPPTGAPAIVTKSHSDWFGEGRDYNDANGHYACSVDFNYPLKWHREWGPNCSGVDALLSADPDWKK